MKTQIKKILIKFWKSWGRDITIVLAIIIPIRSSVADWNHVPTGSMKPTIIEGDRIFVNKLSYGLKFPLMKHQFVEWDNPERGDIVVFYSPEDGRRMVKRVAGIPGDAISMRNNVLRINGEPQHYEKSDGDSLDPEFLNPDEKKAFLAVESLEGKEHSIMINPYKPARRSFAERTIPEGKYFMLGDNRDSSADSRYFGFVDRDNIIGKVSVVVMSLDQDHYYMPRSDRFFKSLK